MRLGKLIAALYVLSLPGLGFAQTSRERATVEAFLHHWHDTRLVTDTDFAPLTALGKKALPLLAQYLSDKELGFEAESAMVHLDARGAMPYLLKALASKDPNIQRDTFRQANRQLMEYDWYVRAGKPKPDATAPAPRYPASTQPYPYRKELHAAAIARLKTLESAVGAEEEAILTVGLTGNKNDIALLRKYEAWDNGRYRRLVIAALARLGDTQAIETICADLAKPVLPHPAEAYYRDNGSKHDPAPGMVVASRDDGVRVRDAAFQAGFSMNRRFVPLLMRHLSDPPGQFHGDYGDPFPAQEAMNALSKLIHGKEYADPAEIAPQNGTTHSTK